MESSTTEELIQLHEGILQNYTGAINGEYRIFKTDLHNAETGRWEGGSTESMRGEIDLEDLATKYSDWSAKWKEIGRIQTIGFMSQFDLELGVLAETNRISELKQKLSPTTN